MVLDKQFLFIIGAPRSGSTWLQAMVGSHPSVCTTAELNLFGRYTVPWERNWEKEVKTSKPPDGFPHGLPVLWTEEEFYGFLREFLERAYTSVWETKPDAAIILDKFGPYSHYVEHINRLIPNSKFIHLVRDGRDVVTSLLAASQGWGRSWAPKGVGKAAAIWKRNVIKAREAQKYGDRYMEVRYEELLSDCVNTLKSIFEFIGLPTNLEEVVFIVNEHNFEQMKREKKMAHRVILPEGFFRKGHSGNWQGALSPIQKYTLHIMVGDLLYELGYADDSWWFDRRYQYFTLPLLHSFNVVKDRSLRVLIRIINNILGSKWAERVRAVRVNQSRTPT